MMRFNPDIHHRRTIRLQKYDYSSGGAYFVTICVQQRECLFGENSVGQMILNGAGKMVNEIWEALPERFQVVQLDQHVVMPNHFHGVVMLNHGRGESCIRPDVAGDTNDQVNHIDRPSGTIENSLGRVMQAFKSMTTNAYVKGVNLNGWPPFPGRLWQRNYFEHVILNEDDLANIRRYIADNPVKWGLDENNPVNAGVVL
jgi:putative transposase